MCGKSKYTEIDCILFAYLKDGYFLSDTFVNVDTKYRWGCKNGHEWEAKFKAQRHNKYWCNECEGGRIIPTTEDCHRLAAMRSGVFLSEKFINVRTKYWWMCKEGHIWNAPYRTIKEKHWCLECSGHAKLSIDDCHLFAKEQGWKCLSTEYVDCNTKYKWQCENGHIWDAKFASLKGPKDKHGCPYCKRVAPLSIDNCYSLAKEMGLEFLSTEYINNYTKYKWRCAFGHEFDAIYTSVYQKHGCPHCPKGKQQREYQKLLEEILGLRAVSNCRDLLCLLCPNGYSQEMDIWFPDIGFGAEIDGQQHFYPVRFDGVSQERAEENFERQKCLDSIKNEKIRQHPEEVKYFIRFSYLEPTTKEYAIYKLVDAGVPLFYLIGGMNTWK